MKRELYHDDERERLSDAAMSEKWVLRYLDCLFITEPLMYICLLILMRLSSASEMRKISGERSDQSGL